MSDLTDFLLARIAEDEHFGTHDRSRQAQLDRECEAKRALVEDRLHLDTLAPGPAHAHAIWVCRVLASAYADHPDYQPGWTA